MVDFLKSQILKILYAWKDGMVLVLWGLAFFTVIMLDYAYNEKTNLWFFVWSIEKLREYGRYIGFSYSSAMDVLSNSFGILITGISIILTTSIQLANRSENKIYGIRRKELNFSKMGFLYKQMRRIAFTTPAIMVVSINLKLCLTGYFILFYTYVFFVLNYVFYLRSYSREQDIKLVINNLVICYKNTEKLSYKIALEDIHREVEKEGCWSEATQIFLNLIEESYHESEKDSFLICNHFFFKVFLECSSEKESIVKAREEIAIYIIEYYLTKNIDECEGELTLESRQYIVFWSMLCCLFEYCCENSIEQFLKWFMNFSVRSSSVIAKKNKIISSNTQYLQTGLILILLEAWLYRNEVSDRQFTWRLKEIWEYGKRILNKDKLGVLRAYADCYGMISKKKEEVLFKIIEVLYEDAEKNIGKSIIWNLVKR